LVIDGDTEINGLNLLLHGPSWNPEKPLIKSEYDAFRVVLRDKAGNLYIENVNIDVAAGAQGQGFGAQLLYDEARAADKLGVRYIETSGAGSFGSDHVGYYALPRYGFTGNLDQEYLDKIAAAVERGELSDSFGSVSTIQDLMSTAQGREWWRVNGGDITGLTFDVSPGSYSMRTLERYVKDRGLLQESVANTADTLAGARAEVRDAQRVLRAAQDAVRADYSRSPQGLLGNRLLDDPRIVSAQARLEAAQARVQELRQTAKAAPTIETAATRSAEAALERQAATKAASQESLDALAQAQQQVERLRAEYSTARVAAGPDGWVEVPANAEKAQVDLAIAQARVDAEMGGRGAIIVARNMPDDPFGASAKLAEWTQTQFGRTLTRDELGGLVGAPKGAYAEIVQADNKLFIDLRGPSTDIFEEYGPASEYEASRELVPGPDGLHMINKVFEVREDLQGQGLGAQIFGDEVQTLSSLGVKYIATGASRLEGYNGYWTWARFGYLGELPDRQLLLDAVARGDLPQSFASYTTVQELMMSPEGQAWWKANGATWQGKFDLAPDSLSMRLFRQYMASKGAI